MAQQSKPSFKLSRRGWLPREGFTGDVLQNIVQNTILNPLLTLPLYLLARYTLQGEGIALDHPVAARRLKICMYLGIARVLNRFMTRGAMNNWTRAKFDWDKELVVITGGSDGFGKILVHLFGAKNPKTRIIVLDVQEPTYELPNDNVHFMKLDLTSLSEIREVSAELKAKFGNPTVILLNAGLIHRCNILNTPDSLLRRTFDVNTLSHYRLMKEFLPAMTARNHGMIVTTASLAGSITPAGMTDYCGSKAAAVAFHEGLSTELVHRYDAPAIRTILVCPNFAATKLADGFKNDSHFLSPTLHAETVAEAEFEKIMSGEGGLVVLPKTHGWLAMTIRAWPLWLHRGMIDRLKEVMRAVELKPKGD